MRCEVILTNIFRNMGCNEGLYHCLRLWCCWLTGKSVRCEVGNKVWPMLPHHQSISHCLTVSVMYCLRLRKYLLHEITSLLSSADVRNGWRYAWSENKVRELATLCLSWQHWTKALVWFDDDDISAFHSCVFVDLWQSLSEWHLLLSACVLVCRREDVGAWIRATNEH